MKYEPRPINKLKEWESRNCRLTLACFLLYLMPLILVLLFFDGGWKLPVTMTMALGIWKSRPGWRRRVGLFVWLWLMIFGKSVPSSASDDERTMSVVLLILVYGASFYFTWYRDGQADLRRRGRSQWEED